MSESTIERIDRPVQIIERSTGIQRLQNKNAKGDTLANGKPDMGTIIGAWPNNDM
jgi:hypothetical protein